MGSPKKELISDRFKSKLREHQVYLRRDISDLFILGHGDIKKRFNEFAEYTIKVCWEGTPQNTK